MVWIYNLELSIPLSANAPDMVGIAFVVTEHVGAVKHHNPRVVGVLPVSCAGPIAQRIPKRNFFTHDRA